MSIRDKLFFMALVWLAVYPGVLLFGYAIDAVVPGWPQWGKILVSTLLTVPLISALAIPRINRVIARVRGESVAEFKRAQARAVE